MAPEKIAQKNKYSSEKADIFSLGVSLIILLFLEYPFGQDRETGQPKTCFESKEYREYAKFLKSQEQALKAKR
jgi:serine/threonine protein kinase